MTVVLKEMFTNYFQKSKIFMYPALKIKRGVSVTPIGTYCIWDGYYTKDDAKLSALYHLREDQEFKKFEAIKLFGNELYCDFKQLEDNLGVFVFDFSESRKDWDNFIKGKYSKLSVEHKTKILNWLGKNNINYGYVDSYLYPERYFDQYSKLLDEPIHNLKKVGELTCKPNFEKECLNEAIINLEITKKVT